MRTFKSLARHSILSLAVFATIVLPGCNQSKPPAPTVAETSPQTTTATLSILAGSENEILEPIVQDYARSRGTSITLKYNGSVDIMRALQDSSLQEDAVWPANTFWLEMGDKSKKLAHRQSVYRTPVVLALKKSVATRLGWIGKQVTVDQFLKAAEAGELRFIMTSATQSNSGACAYLGYLYAFAGQKNALTQTDLKNPAVVSKVKRILGTVNRSSGSSGWLKDLFLKKYDIYDAMVNYECLAIEANQQLEKTGKEPLYVVYLKNGLAVADSPLAFAKRGDTAKEELFKGLQAYLGTAEVQQRIQLTGRRAGGLGLNINSPDLKVFNPEWGISTSKLLVPIRMPQQDVVARALDLYQTAFRKPSATVWCLDYSSSMQGEPSDELKAAVGMILNQEKARQYLIQAAPGDYNAIIPFSDHVMGSLQVRGNDPKILQSLANKVNALAPNGGTNIFAPVAQAVSLLAKQGSAEKSLPAIVLLTDGVSNSGNINEVRAALNKHGLNGKVAVYSITFGKADREQLNSLAELTSGKVFDSKAGLIDAFRKVKGYN